MNLNQITTGDLIKELGKRGYNTSMLWCIADVKQNLDMLNEDRTEEEKINLNETDMSLILDMVCDSDIHYERINEDIQSQIEFYNTEIKPTHGEE